MNKSAEATVQAFYLGLDYGTGGAKAAVIDGDARLAGYAFEEYAILTSADRPGWSEHDAAAYWPVACRLINKACAQADISPAQIQAVASSSALPSLVLVDAEGRPIRNGINLMDRRATAEVQFLKDTIGEDRVFEVTKNRLDDHPAIVNLLWIRENRPEEFARSRWALTIDGYLTLRLTGMATCHYSAAAFYGVAYDLLHRRLDQAMLDEIGIPARLFPPLFYCTDIVGRVTPQAAADTGLRPGVPVAAGQVDCNAGWVGAGALADGDMQMNLGTCGNFGIIHTQPTFHRSMIAFNYTTDTADRPVFITVPTTTTGGGLIRYLRDTIYAAERAAEAQSGADVYDLINDEAAAVPAGSDGLIVLPFLMGERTPIWDVHARGVIFGLSLNHTRGHIARASMEAVAYALYDSFALIRQTGQKINTPFVLNEGGAKSRLWRRIITDVFNTPTVLVSSRAGAPYGDALLAGVATGAFPSFDVARRHVEHVEPMTPDARAHERYMRSFALYKRLYEHVKDDYRALAQLRENR